MKQNGKPRVYSYLRFSSPEQAKGDSERRQFEAAREFAKANGYTFDESLRMADKGLSGFHGTHRKKGALGAFLEKVKTGTVPPGSILVVENIDRLGREAMSDALETIVSGLFKHGITIETLFPRDTYNVQSINTGGIWRLIAHIERAHAESKRKSDLAQANWKQKRKLAAEERRVLTGRAPAWLLLKDGKFHVIEKAAQTVQLIFKLKLEGFGKETIERKLNQAAPWVPKEGWRASYIRKILESRAVIGEFQPHTLTAGKRVPNGEPIPGYFPPVVPPTTFHAVQQQRAGNKKTGGRNGKATNVFQNLVKCGYCGGSMTFIDKGPEPRGGQYLVCDNGRRGVSCKAHKVRYGEFQETMLNNLSKLRPETVLPNATEQSAQAKLLRDAIAGLTGELKDIESRIANLLEQIETTGNASLRARYEQRATDLEAKKPAVQAQLEQKEAALRELERGAQSFTRWQSDLAGLKKAIASDADSRIRLKAHLKEFITKVDVFATGHDENVEHAQELIEDQLPELARAKSYPAFKAYLRKRLLSADARFFRLYLRCARSDSAGLQIAPISSISAGVSIKPDGWKFAGPQIDVLAKEFFDGRKPGFVPKASAVSDQ